MKRESGFIQFVLLFLVLMSVIGVSIFFVNKSATNTILPTPKPSETAQFKHPAFFAKRGFSESEVWMPGIGVAYPKELKLIADKNLIGFQCENRYDADSDGVFKHWGLPINDDNSQSFTTFSDSKLISLLTLKAKEVENIHNSSTLSSIQICNTAEDRRIVIYTVFKHGGGVGQDTYISYLKDDGSLEKEAYLPIEDTAYFSCFKPLLLTTKQVLYMSCAGGDGGSGSASIYKVDLQSSNVSLLVKCETLSADESGNVQKKCTDPSI